MKNKKEYKNDASFVEYVDVVIKKAGNLNNLEEVTRLYSELSKCYNLHKQINENMYRI